MVLLRPVRGLGILRALRKIGSRLLRSRRVLVKNLLFNVFIRLEKRLMAPNIVNIHFSNSERKFEGGFGLRGKDFLNDLFPSVFLTAILIGLGTD